MLSSIISYCSLDKRFIDKNIHECLKFSDKVVVSCSTHFLNGNPDTEIHEFVEKWKNHDKVSILVIPWNPEIKETRYWHNLFRYAGYESVDSDYYLFLDADEIPEGDAFKQFLDSKFHENYDIIGGFVCYYYFREMNLRSTTLSSVGLLIKKEYVKKELFFTDHERWYYRFVPSEFYIQNNLEIPRIAQDVSFVSKDARVMNVDYNGTFRIMNLGKIMFHHYSWVRSKEEMLIKTESWGHKNDKNWKNLIETEFSSDFSGRCFVHGWEYKKIKGDEW